MFSLDPSSTNLQEIEILEFYYYLYKCLKQLNTARVKLVENGALFVTD